MYKIEMVIFYLMNFIKKTKATEIIAAIISTKYHLTSASDSVIVVRGRESWNNYIFTTYIVLLFKRKHQG